MKKVLTIILTLFAILSVQATRRALVIGIGPYPQNSGWDTITGDLDIPIVEEMLLINGFEKQHIVKLKNEQATCAAICQELENLIAQSELGDIVYIQFSGHGQQITDLNGDETDDGLDEAWIPYDAPLEIVEGIYEGENHLVDDQINFYLHRLRQRIGADGKIVVIADACHSGGSTRGEDDVVIRGTDKKFTITNIQQAISRFTSMLSQVVSRSHITTPQPTALEWVVISACKDYQFNQEYNGRGSLTTALYQNRKLFGTQSIQDVFNNIRTFYLNASLRYTQNPVLEVGNGNKENVFL